MFRPQSSLRAFWATGGMGVESEGDRSVLHRSDDVATAHLPDMTLWDERSHEETESVSPGLERSASATGARALAVAEDEAAYRSTTATVMQIPVKLVPAVRALLAKRRAS